MSSSSSPITISSTDFNQIPFDVLESIRNRLNQIHTSLKKLADQINNHNRYPSKIKLPNFNQFQNQFQVLITQLTSIASILQANEELLLNTNVYPTPIFPTQQQEGLLTTLLRKKALPEVDEWINASKSTLESNETKLNDEFTLFCLSKLVELRDEFQFYGFNTIEELDNMETPEAKQEVKIKNEKELEKEEIELKDNFQW
ncbi:unnamed protein product [Candida verbasci]|uniref:Mediator of RNA polymerase II transcription subunit 8 n=1 Tax=Candida verbasci TaxID=1227364 RepID=A0A9W4XGF9_9ASCO|nr:unnamed protein product [Candida verbasci]